jgi:hypothetical protein
MYGLKVRKLVIICVDTGAEKEAGVATIYNFRCVSEFDEVGLMFLVAGGY